jgi:hypothetical protein
MKNYGFGTGIWYEDRSQADVRILFERLLIRKIENYKHGDDAKLRGYV